VTVLQIIFNSLVPASLYCIMSIGFVIVYRTTGVLNFAQGQAMLLGGYFFSTLAQSWIHNFTLSVIAVAVAGLIGGGILYVGILRSLTGQNVVTAVMFTVILGNIFDAVTGITWGTAPRTLTTPIKATGFHVTKLVVVTYQDLAIIVAAVVLSAGIGGFVRLTRHGTAMRAAAENPQLASYRGINVIATAALAWSIGGLVALLGGTAYGIYSSVDSSVINLGYVAFAAVLLGGLESIGGAVLGSLIVALVQATVVHFVNAGWSDVTAFILLLLVLLIRPYGLFGAREIVRV
jgi:branched-chain amino acid transport system permease protein